MNLRPLTLILFLCSLSLPAQLTRGNNSLQDSIYTGSVLLDEVIVRARNKNIGSRGLGNMRMNIKQLEITPLFLGERDVIKTLQFLPGVSAGMEGSSQLNIRGGTNDQTLYLLDDVPIYNQNHTFGLFSSFNSDAIHSVDIYKGGIPASFGDRLSGIVSIGLKDGNFRKYNNAISLGMLAGTITSEGPIIKDKVSYLFSGRRSFVDLFYNAFLSLSGSNSGGTPSVSFYDLNGKITWKLNHRNNLSWLIYTGYDDISGVNWGDQKYPPLKYRDKFGFGWKTLMSAFQFRSQLNEKLSMSANFYYTKQDNFNTVSNKQVSPDAKLYAETRNSALLSEIGNKTTFTHQTSDNNTLYYGLEGAYQIYTPDYNYKQVNNDRVVFNVANLGLSRFSSYINDDWKHKKWLLSGGLRISFYDNTKIQKIVFEPRLKINYQINVKNKIMIAFDRMYQPINSINEINYTSKSDRWIPFQEKNLPQSDQLSMGWKNEISQNLSFSIEAYYKSMKNLLLIKDLEYYINSHTDYYTGSGKSVGFEFMTEYTSNRFTAWLSYTLSKSQRTFDGKTYPFKYNAPHDISLFGSYIVNKTQRRTGTFALQVQFRSGFPYVVPELSFPGMGLPTQSKSYNSIQNSQKIDYISYYPNTFLKNYFRIDVNYTIVRQLKYGNISWQFSLLNLTNHQNVYSIYKKEDKYKAIVLIPLLPSISVKRTF